MFRNGPLNEWVFQFSVLEEDFRMIMRKSGWKIRGVVAAVAFFEQFHSHKMVLRREDTKQFSKMS